MLWRNLSACGLLLMMAQGSTLSRASTYRRADLLRGHTWIAYGCFRHPSNAQTEKSPRARPAPGPRYFAHLARTECGRVTRDAERHCSSSAAISDGQLTPSRHIIIAEGASHALLLPSLIREVGRFRSLPFQIVSGFAEASDCRAASTGHGNPARRLPRGRGWWWWRPHPVRPRVGHREGALDPVVAADIPAMGRPAAIRAWCRANGVKEDGKIDVAQDVLRLYQADSSSDRRLSDRAMRKAITHLYKRMLRALRIRRQDAEAFSRRA